MADEPKKNDKKAKKAETGKPAKGADTGEVMKIGSSASAKGTDVKNSERSSPTGTPESPVPATTPKGTGGQPVKSNNMGIWIAVAVIIIAVAVGAYFVFSAGGDDESETTTTSPTQNTIPLQQNSLIDNDGVDEALASVNGEPVMESDVEQTKTFLETQLGQKVNDETALNQAVSDTLALQEAEERGIEISTSEAEQQLVDILQAQGNTLEDLKQQAEAQGEDYDASLERIRQQLIVQELIQDVVGDVSITDVEARAFYEQNQQALFQGQEAPPYEGVEPQLKDFLERQEVQEKFQAYLETLRQEAEIEYEVDVSASA